MNKVTYSNIDTLNKIFILKIVQESYDLEFSSNLLLESLDDVYGYEKFNKYFIVSGINTTYEIVGKDLIVQYSVMYEFASIYGVKEKIKEYNLESIKEYLSKDENFINSFYLDDDHFYLGINNSEYKENAHETYDQYVTATETSIKNKLSFLNNKFIVSTLEYSSDFLLIKLCNKKNKDDDFDESFNTAIENFLLKN